MIPQLFDPWLITEPGLRLVFNVATRNAIFTEDRIRALQERDGRPLQNTRTATIRDGVAIIPVQGPLFRHASMMTEISGATAYETIAKDHAAALADPAVREIRFYMDSPGGLTSGCFELSAAIKKARGIKRTVAIVEGDCCSACYAIACACDEIVCSPSSRLGSIGAVMSAVDRTEAQKASGELEIEFVSSVSPDKRPDIKTAAGREIYQKQVDDIGDLFVATVAENRGRTPAYVLEHFGQGGVKMGAAAVAAGLADRLSDFESSLAEAAGRPSSAGVRMLTDKGITAAAKNEDDDEDEDKEGDDAETKARKAKARKAKAKAKAEKDDEEDDDGDECKALGIFALSLSGAPSAAAARGILAAAMDSHREVAGLRERTALAETAARRVELRQILEAGLMGERPTLSLGKIQAGMLPLLRGAARAAWQKAMSATDAKGELLPCTQENVLAAACSVALTADDLESVRMYAQSSPALAAPMRDEPERDGVAEQAELDETNATIDAALATIRKSDERAAARANAK